MRARLRFAGSCRPDQTVHAAWGLQRKRGMAALLVAACALACIGSVARANPAPTAIVYTHIHGGLSDFCNTLPVPACEEIVQVVDATGILNFDMILPWPHEFEWLYGWATNLEFTVQWPAEWQFVDASACGSGVTDVVHEGNSATFSIENLEGAPVNGDVLGIGRLVLNVTSEGATSCPDWPWPMGIDWIGGRISACGNCLAADCAHWEPIRPVLPSPLLELAADCGGTASGQFHVGSSGLEHGSPPNEYAFSTSVPWITLDLVSIGTPWFPEYDVTVTADAQTLEPGVYETWVEVQGQYCYECERIVFTVPEHPSPAVPDSWGSLKTKFR
jgi:hypothetical protein